MFNQPVKSLMDPRKLILAPGTTTVREAARLMKSKHYGAVLVMLGDELRGIFTERDAVFRVLAVGKDPETTTVEQVMTAEPKTA